MQSSRLLTPPPPRLRNICGMDCVCPRRGSIGAPPRPSTRGLHCAGVYRRVWETDGRINSFDTGLSKAPSAFEGYPNANSNETIHDMTKFLRPNLAVGKTMRPF